MHRARAVVVVDESCDAAEMAARGARWARFNAVGGNGAPLDRLERLAERIAPLGWHVQLYAPADALPALEPVLRRLPVPVVVDHLGGVKAAAGGVEHPGFRALLRLVENGAWAKLCGYRASAGPPCGEVAPMARALLAAAPDRCVWGTDWLRPSLHDPAEVPGDGALLDALGVRAPGEAGGSGEQPGAALRLCLARRLHDRADRDIVAGMKRAQPRSGTIRTARFWYRWYTPAA